MVKLVIVSTFWNVEKYIGECIDSLQMQTHTDFLCYLIDDMSTDNTCSLIQNKIVNDKRFILIKNKEKKFKTRNFVDTIRDNVNIADKDIIVEIYGDDKLVNKNVFSDIWEVYKNPDIWISNSRLIDNNGKPYRNDQKVVFSNLRRVWQFSHLRTFRAFLFRLIPDKNLRFNGEYCKAACDVGHSIPMLEMAGPKHYYFLNKVTYFYRWHDKQTARLSSPVKNPDLQRETAGYILKLPKIKEIT